MNNRRFQIVLAKCIKRVVHDPNKTSSPTSNLGADIAHCYANPQDILAADRQLLNRPISKVLKSKRAHRSWLLLTWSLGTVGPRFNLFLAGVPSIEMLASGYCVLLISKEVLTAISKSIQRLNYLKLFKGPYSSY